MNTAMRLLAFSIIALAGLPAAAIEAKLEVLRARYREAIERHQPQQRRRGGTGGPATSYRPSPGPARPRTAHRAAGGAA